MNRVFMINNINVPNIWSQIEPILEPAIKLFGTHELEDVRKSIMCGNSHLWAELDIEAKAAAVTEFVSYPKGLWLRIWLFGVKNGVNAAWEEFEKNIIEFAKLSKCIGIEHYGREGWQRRDPKIHKKISIIYRMVLT